MPTLGDHLRGQALALKAEHADGLLAMTVPAEAMFSDEDLGPAAPEPTEDGVAVVPVVGPLLPRGDWLSRALGFPDYRGFVATLEAAADDPRVSSIVLELDSPGGSVAGMLEAAQAVAEVAKR